MSDLAAVAAVLRAVAEVGEGPFAALHSAIRLGLAEGRVDTFRTAELRTEVFSGMPASGGAGAAAHLVARRADGLAVSWTVQVWIEDWRGDGSPAAAVKGEVDVDDLFGEPETLRAVERTATDIPATVDAIHGCAADLVAAEDLHRLAASPVSLSATIGALTALRFEDGLVLEAAGARLHIRTPVHQTGHAHGDDAVVRDGLWAASVSRDGTLDVQIEGRGLLRVPPDDRQETWTFDDDEGRRAVCRPGGEVLVWGRAGADGLSVGDGVPAWPSRA